MTNIEDKIVDVVYDANEIFHVLEPNEEGVRGVPINQLMIRDSIGVVRVHLASLDQAKIDEFVDELRNEL